MTYFALNLLLAIVWTFLAGSFSIRGLSFGFVVGYFVLLAAQPFLPCSHYVQSVRGVFRFLWVYASELFRANILLARDLLRPVLPFRPGFIRYQTGGLSLTETTVLANMISLTPGTMTVDYGDNGQTLYIHTLYAGDPDKLRHDIQLFAHLIDGVTGHVPAPVSTPEEEARWKQL